MVKPNRASVVQTSADKAPPDDTPEHLLPYVETLGAELAMDFFLEFGGAPVYLAASPKSRSSVVALVGRDRAVALADRLGPGHLRVPTAKRWIARHLHARGEPIVSIARRLHVTDVSVRAYVRDERSAQLTLFG